MAMPTIFIGHGSPENAVGNNSFTKNWKNLALAIPRPKAIVSISAHWLTEGTAITSLDRNRTIHDFYGFPEKLYKLNYDAKGDPKLARKIKGMVRAADVNLDSEWGLDHGTWSVLINMYPDVKIPVLQLSLDYNLPLKTQMQIGKELRRLREEEILILGSGNLVHNLMLIRQEREPYDWANEFDSFISESLVKKDYENIINYSKKQSGLLSHPTYDHFLPLLYVLGASGDEDPHFFNDKIVMGSVSMRCVVYSDKKIKI